MARTARDASLATRSARLRLAVAHNTKVLIGHSLGSVVAYEAAHIIKQPLPLLITLGSSLGLQTIAYQRLRPQPPSFPPMFSVGSTSPTRTTLSLPKPHLERLFSRGVPAGTVFEGVYTVDNGADPHNANFYLGKAQVGRPTGEVLGSAAVAAH
jgi:alpha-beta hydrolase superfamily lysophospholipase